MAAYGGHLAPSLLSSVLLYRVNLEKNIPELHFKAWLNLYFIVSNFAILNFACPISHEY